MYSYTIWQWILLFFTYSFFGWIWEIIFLSVKNLRFVADKGVLHGPLRTMYGSAAVILILVAAPLQKNFLLTYLAGMAGATILELIVGFIFERIFNIKCWDYSKMPFNIAGHICLPASLLWGLFTVLFIKYLHPVVHAYIISIPPEITRILAIGLMLLLLLDTLQSFSQLYATK